VALGDNPLEVQAVVVEVVVAEGTLMS